MTITIPEGMEITPEDMDRGEIEVLAAFSIDEDGMKLTLKTIDGMPIEAEMEEEEEMEEGEEGETEAMPTEEETIGQFVRGQLSQRGM